MANAGVNRIGELVIFVPMKKNGFKIRALLISSVFLVIVLIAIQFYLVLNTYRITKEKYFKEVVAELQLINKKAALETMDIDVVKNLDKLVELFIKKLISKDELKFRLKKTGYQNRSKANKLRSGYFHDEPLLKDIRYRSQFDQIVIEMNGKQDTILSNTGEPLLYIGEKFDNSNTYRISDKHSDFKVVVSAEEGEQKQITGSQSHDITIRKSEYIDISGWQRQVVTRMTLIFMLAAGLIIAVILLFFLVLRALFKEKKLADIKTDFANNITHELQTPLSSMNLIFKSLARQEVKQNTLLLEDLLQSLNRQYEKIQQSVDSVLESAISGKDVFELKEVDITTFLNAYAKNFPITSHPFEMALDARSISLNTNTTVLEKILNNLLENAMKYTTGGTSIMLRSYVSAQNYVIEVSDTGPGIAKAHHAYIFDKFYRVSEANQHAVKGLGLGLHYCKQAVTGLGGSITLDSAMGTGTTFIIKLPLYEN
jgi:two-component system phosphate regulon sensor histidine kinase PhoR